MKTYRWVILGVIACLVIAVVSYLWATSLMASLYAYRSPLAAQPPKAGQPAGPPLSKLVVAILVDGLRNDTAADSKAMPSLNNLRSRGASTTVHSVAPSYSAPAWSVLATGAWQDISDGPAMNPTAVKDYRYWSQDNIFTSVSNAGRRTAVAANQNFKNLVPPGTFAASLFTEDETQVGDQQIADAAVQFIKSGKYELVVVHLVQLDHAAHYEGGTLDPRWDEATLRADGLIGQIAGALDLTQDTVMVFSDHGQIDAGGHGGQDAIVLVQPFVMAGAGVKPGAYAGIGQVDIAPTTTVLLGSALPAISQGRPLTEMLELSPGQLAAVRQATASQQEGLYQAYAAAMKVPAAKVIPPADADPAGTYQAAMQEIKDNRLNSERVVRSLLVLPLVVLPPFLLIRYRNRSLLWVLLAAAVYLAAFYILYAVLNGGTFTLSSVLSASNLIQTTAVYSALAFLAAWLVILLGLRLFARPRLQAVHYHLVMTFTLIYIIALPALWSLAYNGALVGWTLPDVGSMFAGFIFTLQLVFVPIAGLLMMAVTALAAGWKKERKPA